MTILLKELHYCILDVHSNHFSGHPRLAKFYDDDKNYVRNTNFFQWLDVFINLMILGSNINAVDLHGRSVLHLAAKNGLADAVNVLMQEKSQLDVLISLVRHHWQQLSRTSQWDQSNGCLRLEIP